MVITLRAQGPSPGPSPVPGAVLAGGSGMLRLPAGQPPHSPWARHSSSQPKTRKEVSEAETQAGRLVAGGEVVVRKLGE